MRYVPPWRLWAVPVAVALLGWCAGFLLWQPWMDGPDYRAATDLWLPTVMVVLGTPAAIASGVLFAFGGRWNRVGWIPFVLLCLGLAWFASFAFFGGFCIDPGDVCKTTWSGRALAIFAAVWCAGAGWVTHSLGARISKRYGRGPRALGPAASS